MAGSADRIAVVGGGIAGQSLCEKLRERDPDVGITLVCGEPHPPYDRVHLSDLLAGDAPEDPLGDLRGGARVRPARARHGIAAARAADPGHRPAHARAA